MNKETFSNNLKNLRTSANMTQPTAAKALEVSTSTYLKWEKENSTAWPNILQLIKMSSIFGCNISDFFIDEFNDENSATNEYDDYSITLRKKYLSLDDLGKDVVKTNLEAQLKRCTQKDFILLFDVEPKDIEPPIFIPKTHPDYYFYQAKIAELKKLKRKTCYTFDSLRHQLVLRGYNGYISIMDLVLMFNEVKVPSSRLYADVKDIFEAYLNNVK